MLRPPVVSINLSDFRKDPYPVMAELRRTNPVAQIPELNAVVFSRRSDIVSCEKNTDVFSSHQPDGLMNSLMGLNMMRKDGAAHIHERKMLLPVFVGDAIKTHWKPFFKKDVEARLNEMQAGSVVDLFTEYALPVSADALRRITGLPDGSATELDDWSQAMIDGVANYHGDGDTEKKCRQATAAIDVAVNRQINELKNHSQLQFSDRSMIATMLYGELPLESIRSNIKLAISGGQNEPRDAIAGTIWALLTHPDQLQLIRSGAASWSDAFEEYCRWISPIGMSPRRIAKSHCIHDMNLLPDERVFFLFSSANRDEEVFENPDDYTIKRDNSRHIAFGAGPHFCIAAAVSRCLVSEVALPMLFERFPGMKLLDTAEIRWDGWAFRGLKSLPVELLA